MNLQGSCVISGTAKAVIVGAGSKSYVAGIAAALPSGRTKNAFDYVTPSTLNYDCISRTRNFTGIQTCCNDQAFALRFTQEGQL